MEQSQMDDLCDVDVSWLHHSNHAGDSRRGDQLLQDETDPNTDRQENVTYVTSRYSPITPSRDEDGEPSVATTPLSTPLSKPLNKRSSLLNRSAADKQPVQNASFDDAKTTPRRNSWISSISSKFSSQTHPSPPQHSNLKHLIALSPSSLLEKQSLFPKPTPQERVVDNPEPYVPQQPKITGSFFSSALRRLSPGSQIGSAGKLVENGGVCPRRVMNIDPHRSRCVLPELDQSRLRRVAFCVDVEIARGPRYNDEQESFEKWKEAKENKRDRPGGGVEVHESLGDLASGSQELSEATSMATKEQERSSSPISSNDKHATSRKKEKKKRSEEERRGRKEQKRRKAEDSGSIPLQLTRAIEDHGSQTNFTDIGLKRLDGPTIDPLRIYRRCCQLRETVVIQSISDQISPTPGSIDISAGVVPILNLTGSRLKFDDVVTLSDWLAVVPVVKLILEDADLTDEGIRLILAGLLAARQSRLGRRTASTSHRTYCETEVIEKLSLKNNPKIGMQGWKHICLFLYMCRSIRALDVSKNTLPPVKANRDRSSHIPNTNDANLDIAEVLSKAMAERLGGSTMEELILAECSLHETQIRRIVDGVSKSGLKRLSLAGNNIGSLGLVHIARYIRSGVCEGIDLGGNGISDHIDTLCNAMNGQCPLSALSLADCGLEPTSLKPLFPALLSLPDLRFLDLSHNPALFSNKPTALGVLREYVPQLRNLKRIHLASVSMSPSQAIALVEVLPECPHLAHLNILGNPQLSALANTTDEEGQEEACALYASLMAAARVSRSIIRIDVDIPTAENSEIVKALAKQVVAYCLRNLDRITSGDGLHLPDPESIVAIKDADVPNILLHLVGPSDGQHVVDETAPNNDYIVGGTGVVKALNYCLSERAADLHRGSLPRGGSMMAQGSIPPQDVRAARAKVMSKTLLESARRIRMRLQPALFKEAKGDSNMTYRRLLFLDNTLNGMIRRFEDEYPECRTESTFLATLDQDAIANLSAGQPSQLPLERETQSFVLDTDVARDVEEADENAQRRCHISDVCLASKALSQEEGRVHRIGLKVKHDLFKIKSGDSEDSVEAEKLKALQENLAGLKPDHLS